MAETTAMGSMYPSEDLKTMKGLEHLTVHAERAGTGLPKEQEAQEDLTHVYSCWIKGCEDGARLFSVGTSWNTRNSIETWEKFY